MNRSEVSKPVQWTVWSILFVVIAVILGLFARQQLTTVESKLPIYSVLRDFSLTNQNNAVVSLEDLRGKVWVADIIFTRCPGPCRRMTKDMARLQDLWPTNAPVRFVSLTSDPNFDTPAVLRRFATDYKADTNRWDFLTGTKHQIVETAADFKFARVEKTKDEQESENDLFIHSTIFLVVDKHGQIRSTVESDQPDALTRTKELVDELLQDR
jgi:protein SCO1/2